jgi:AAA family ATP:ADP antiporter
MTNISTNEVKPTMLEKAIQIVWPIEMRELKKFLPMAFIMFCILFNYSSLRGLKDSLVVSAIGAEAISFVKLWIVIPGALLFTICYMKLLNKFGDTNVFYVITGAFLSYFVLFTFVLYPNEHSLHPDPERIKMLAEELPRLKWFLFLYGKWIYVTMFLFAELWGSIMLSLLFWQFANKVTSTTEAKRFYSMFGLIGNFSLVASGTVMKSVATAADNKDAIVNMMFFVMLFSGLCMFFYFFVNRYVLTDPKHYSPEEKKASKGKKPKLSIGESLKIIFSSKYLGFILLLVLGYGITIILVEGPWKNKVKELYPTKEAYLHFYGIFNQCMGTGAIILMFIGSNILRLTSWRTAALATPIVILLTGVGFFVFSLFTGLDSFLNSTFGISVLVAAVFLGAAQNVLSKGVKYSLFDSTKEMSYIPLDNELKTKGKAAVDVIGGRLGKGGGAFIISTLFTIFPSATFNTDYLLTTLMVIFVIIVVAWLFAVNGLSKEYEKSVNKQ